MNRLVVSVLSILISNAACDVSVTRSKQSVPLNHNQGFTLRCTVTAPDTFDKWSNPLYTSSIHNDSNIQYTKSGDEHDLQIVSMKLVIAGKWTCSSKQGNSDYITIEVTPSRITPSENKQILIKDKPGAIKIDIRGYPPPDFTWKKDGVKIDNSTGRYHVATNGTLIISNVETGDAGTYDATGEKNLYLAKSGDIVVSVLVAPSISGKAIRESRTIGGNISFDCTASGTPTPNITWRKGLNMISNGGRFAISEFGLLITDIIESDAGNYTCVASNDVGSAQLTSSLLSVYVPPEITPALSPQKVEKGMSLIVSCNATGSPAPTVEWYKDANILPSSQQVKSPGKSVLKITNIQVDQAGVYECVAENGALDAMGDVIKRTESMKVDVVYPPEFGKMKETIHVRLNKPVEIICNASGIPRPVIKLSFKSKEMQGTVSNVTSSQSTLTYRLNNTSVDDLGLYTCTASNGMKDIQKSITLSVPLDKPDISDVNTTCDTVSFSWHRDTQRYTNINSYEVTVRRSSDSTLVKLKQVASNDTLKVKFTGLDESTEYKLKVKQETDVGGIGLKSTGIATTAACPLRDINAAPVKGNEVTVYWPKATKAVGSYLIKYRVKGSADEWSKETTEKIFIEIKGLDYGSTYEFQVFYEDEGNEIPHTKIREVQIPTAPTTTPTPSATEPGSTTVKPSDPKEKPPGAVARKGGLSGGAIAAIVIVIILLVLIAVDIFCCFFNQCGVVHMCAAACAGRKREKYHVDGTEEEGTKLKEVDEEGKKEPEV